MSRTIRGRGWGVAAAVGFLVAPAPAQTPFGPAQTPTVSPYLNLLRYGNPGYLNYYGLVQPQLQAQEQYQNLQGQLQGLNANQQAMTGTGGLATGMPFGYFTHRGYFLNNRSGGQGAGGGFGGGVVPGNLGGGFGGMNPGNFGGFGTGGLGNAAGFGRTNYTNPNIR